jgi:hypothetical protein
MGANEEAETKERSSAGYGRATEQETFAQTPEGDSERRGAGTVGHEGAVYFIETHDGAFVKIGYSATVPRRFDGIKLLLPGLRLVGHLPGTYETERWLHAKFAEYRDRGEWFRQAAEVRAFIAAIGLIPPAAVAVTRRRGRPRLEKKREVREVMATKKKKRVDADVSAAAAAMGRKGGANRAKSLTAARRAEIASEAAKARWGDKAPAVK